MKSGSHPSASSALPRMTHAIEFDHHEPLAPHLAKKAILLCLGSPRRALAEVSMMEGSHQADANVSVRFAKPRQEAKSRGMKFQVPATCMTIPKTIQKLVAKMLRHGCI